jgi:hypothetical protein
MPLTLQDMILNKDFPDAEGEQEGTLDNDILVSMEQ